MSFEHSGLPFELVQHLVVDVRGLIDQLHEKALAHLFAATPTAAAAAKSVEKLPQKERDGVIDRVRRALRASRADKDDLEALAALHDVPHDRKTPADLLVLRLEEKMGAKAFDAKAEELLAPLDYRHRGSFSTFEAPPLPADLKAAEVAHDIELAVEKYLSRGRDKRKARVRATADDGGFVVVVYFERPHLDGRKLDAKKKLRAELFERPAADTFFWLRPASSKTRLIQRVSGRELARAIRAALGKAIWGNESAVSDTPSDTYNLQKTMESSFALPVPPNKGVRSAALHEIELRAASGNMVRIKASGESHDVLPDFTKMAHLHKGATVTSIVVKLTVETASDKTKMVPVTVRRTEVTVDAAYMSVLLSLLKSWGLSDG
jgi:hypothetical protein